MASDSLLSERALREIYLKGFEIAIYDGETPEISKKIFFISSLFPQASFLESL